MNSSESNSSTNIFSHMQKKKIASRIENITLKKHYKAIFRIVHENNNSYTKNDSGIFLTINLYDDITLTAIQDYLDTNLPIVNSIPLTTKFKPYCSDSTSVHDSSLKLTNQEKNFLRKIDNNNESDKNSLVESDIVVKQDKIIIKPFN